MVYHQVHHDSDMVFFCLFNQLIRYFRILAYHQAAGVDIHRTEYKGLAVVIRRTARLIACKCPHQQATGSHSTIGRPATEAGQMVLNAIRNDRAVIVTDPSHRPGFDQGFVRLVQEAFDDAAAFDAQLAKT